MKLLKNNLGFTMLEIVMAVAIFTTATVITSDIFIRVNKAQRKTQGIQETASDARFAVESLARTARMGEIDYSYYGAAVDIGGESVLALRTVSGVPIKFSRQNGVVCPDNDATVYCLAVCLLETCTDGTADWQPITPEGVNVALLNFLIYPLQDPFEFDSLTGDYNDDVQPRMTVISRTENVTSLPAEKKEFEIQTTVSTRVYKR